MDVAGCVGGVTLTTEPGQSVMVIQIDSTMKCQELTVQGG